MHFARRASVLSTAVAATLISANAHLSFASSYASGVTEASGTITFNLDEDAQNVIILRDGVPTSLGAKARGTVSFTRDSAVDWQIQIVQSGGLGFATSLPTYASGNTTLNPLGGSLQAQADSASSRFGSVRGVDVNTNTSDLSLFGRVYVANSADGAALGTLTNVGATLPARGATSKGIYVLDSKLSDVLAQGDTGLLGGIDFYNGNAASPFRLTVGPDNNVYIADWSDAHGSVYRVDPNISPSSGLNLLAGIGSSAVINPTPSLNHGSIAGVAVSGTSADGNLKIYTVDEDMQETANGTTTLNQLNSLWRYDVDGNATPYSDTPTHLANASINFVSQTADVARGSDGKLYMSDSRSSGVEAGLRVVDDTGTLLWDSRSASIALGLDANDVLRSVNGVTVSKDNKYVAMVNINNIVWVVPIDQSTGLPDLTKRVQFNGFGTTGNGRDIAFDAADNLYVVSSGYAAIRAFSPGGTSITTLSSDGTFTTQSATPEWQNAGSDSTTNAANWPLGVIPNVSGAFVKFGSAITAPSTVTIGAATTYGSILFDNANSYTLSGSTITLNSPTYQTAPTVFVSSGDHKISSNLAISRTATFSINTGSTLTVAGTLSGSGGVTANAPGTLLITSAGSSGALTARGTSTIRFSSANASLFTAISTFTTGGTPAVNTFTGTVDLNTSKLVINYAATTLTTADTTRTQLANGYAGGAWNGLGINSSAAAADPMHIHSIGYVEANDKFGAAATWFGKNVDTTALLLAYTYAGDADLSLTISGDDFALLDRGYAKYAAGTIAAGAAHWSDGDFDYNGTVDSADYLILDTTKGKLDGVLSPDYLAAREAQFGEAYVSSLVAAVPEPTTLGLAITGIVGLASRRRRK